MKKDIYDFTQYRAYLNFHVGQMPRGGRGFRSEIARTIPCQTAYVSQVFNERAHFSLEQAIVVSQLIGHDQDERRYFLLMVDYARSDRQDLKRHFLELMDEAKERQFNLKERFRVKSVLSENQEFIYYSSWYISAIHILASVPDLATEERISQVLQIPISEVKAALTFLIQAGLVEENKGGFTLKTARIHLGESSPLLKQHHTNWRLQSLKTLDSNPKEALRYTSVVSLSHKDRIALRKKLIAVIEEFNSTIAKSDEETVACLLIDFFGLS